MAFASGAEAVPVELLSNGGFETGSTAGWVVSGPSTGSCGQNFVVSTTGSSSGCAGYAPVPSNFVSPYEGQYAAYAAFDGGGPLHHTITQTFAVNGAINWSTVSWMDALGFGDGWLFTEPRVYSVNLLDGGGQLVASLYSQSFTNQVGGVFQSWVLHNVDISPYLAQLAGVGQLQFDLWLPQNFTGPGVFGLDRVSVLGDTVAVAQVPEPSALLLFGAGLLGLGALCRGGKGYRASIKRVGSC